MYALCIFINDRYWIRNISESINWYKHNWLYCGLENVVVVDMWDTRVSACVVCSPFPASCMFLSSSASHTCVYAWQDTTQTSCMEHPCRSITTIHGRLTMVTLHRHLVHSSPAMSLPSQVLPVLTISFRPQTCIDPICFTEWAVIRANVPMANTVIFNAWFLLSAIRQQQSVLVFGQLQKGLEMLTQGAYPLDDSSQMCHPCAAC